MPFKLTLKQYNLSGLLGAAVLAVAASSLLPIRLLIFLLILFIWALAGALDEVFKKHES